MLSYLQSLGMGVISIKVEMLPSGADAIKFLKSLSIKFCPLMEEVGGFCAKQEEKYVMILNEELSSTESVQVFNDLFSKIVKDKKIFAVNNRITTLAVTSVVGSIPNHSFRLNVVK